MTSTSAVQSEIKRFLTSADPEVLCIVGEWGVGKTYNWQTSVDRLRSERSIALSRYSYVSLFGINSLEGLKNSIFENLEFLVPEGASTMGRLINSANRAFTGAKQYTDMVGAIPVIGNAVSRLQPHLFSTIRNQIVCIDDLERRGKGLDVKDVFGLISFLREQRGCKIVLLLNEGQLDKEAGAKEFADYFEKVIDTKVIFAPTAEEAVNIAITGDDGISKQLAKFCIKLGVSNIRVIKKIERLVQMVVPLVVEFNPVIAQQVVHSLVMFGWCKFDAGARPPPLEYLKVGPLVRYVDRRNGAKATEDEVRWDGIISRYEFGNLDDFDHTLMEFVKVGVLDTEELSRRANVQNANLIRQSKAGSYGSSWRCFHDSFADNEQEVCKSLMDGITNNLDVVSISDVDGVLNIFKGLDRTDLVDALIKFVSENAAPSFWLTSDFFNRGPVDDALKDIATKRREDAKPKLDFEADLVSSAQDFNAEKLAQLAKVPVQQYRDLFLSRTDEQMRRVILSALEHRRILNASDDQKEIVRKAEDALKEIGNMSRLNAIRVSRYAPN
jgi:KAP-like P-loop domain-containing protein